MLEIKRSKLRAGPRRKQAYARFRKVLIVVIVLVLLFGAAGILYTWYMGRQPAPVVEEPKIEKKQTVQTPSKPSEDAKVSAAIQSFTTPVRPGSNASISIHTLAGAACSIEVVYKDKQVSTDSGLMPKVADEFGIVSWTWSVESFRPVGTWPVNITCAYNSRSAYLRGDLVVTDKVE